MQKFPFVLAVFIQNNHILLLLRQNTGHLDGLYALPGGKVEEGESLRAALMREVYEEVGVTLNAEHVSLIHVLSWKNKEGVESAHFCFLIQQWEGELYNKEPEKHAELQWFPLNALPGNIIERHKQDVQMIQKGILYSEFGW